MRAGLLLTAIPGLAQRFKPVPQGYMRHLGGNQAMVACVCGRRPILDRGELVHCEKARSWVPTRTACGRHFIYANRAVLVYRETA
jgi:hypothetical protein